MGFFPKNLENGFICCSLKSYIANHATNEFPNYGTYKSQRVYINLIVIHYYTILLNKFALSFSQNNGDVLKKVIATEKCF